MKAFLAAIHVAAAASIGLSAGTALAQDNPPAGAQAAAPLGAAEYLRKAASGDQFEIQSSELALRNARDAETRTFAQTLIADHTRLSRELKDAATGAGITPPAPALAPHHAQALQRLREAKGAAFDPAYRRAQIAAHEEALALHRGYAASGTVPALKAAAEKAVPTIEAHLRHARSLGPRSDAAAGSGHGEAHRPGPATASGGR